MILQILLYTLLFLFYWAVTLANRYQSTDFINRPIVARHAIIQSMATLYTFLFIFFALGMLWFNFMVTFAILVVCYILSGFGKIRYFFEAIASMLFYWVFIPKE